MRRPLWMKKSEECLANEDDDESDDEREGHERGVSAAPRKSH